MLSYIKSKFNDNPFEYKSIDDFIRRFTFKDGTHTIKITDGQNIDILIQGEEFCSDSHRESLLVVFTAAMFDRTGKKPPYFSGKTLANSLDIPLVSISDPTLTMDENIPIGWYAGNRDIPNLAMLISRIVNKIALLTNWRPIMVGGSGAGFASLVQSTLVEVDAIACVWNPQTDIDKYSVKYVEQYYTLAFGQESRPKEHISKVVADKIKPNMQILYLQNISDWHTQKHTLPLFNGLELNRYFHTTFINSSGKVAFYFGDWGKGHVVPPYQMIKDTLSSLIGSGSVPFTTMMLEKNREKYDTLSKKIFLLDTQKDDFPCVVDVSQKDSKVSVVCSMKDGADDSSLKFAYYLLNKGNRIDTKWYTSEKEAEFVVDKSIKTVSVIVFVKDILGTMHRKQFRVKEE